MTYKYVPPAARNPAEVRRDIEVEFGRWNEQAGSRVIMDWDLPYIKAALREATVTFILRGQQRRVRVDAWDDFRVNFVCCYLIIRDMRLAEARGLTEAIREAYGLLPAPPTQRDPYEILGIRPDTPLQDVEDMYRIKARRLHPDTNPSDGELMKELNVAMDRIREERKVPA